MRRALPSIFLDGRHTSHWLHLCQLCRWRMCLRSTGSSLPLLTHNLLPHCWLQKQLYTTFMRTILSLSGQYSSFQVLPFNEIHKHCLFIKLPSWVHSHLSFWQLRFFFVPSLPLYGFYSKHDINRGICIHMNRIWIFPFRRHCSKIAKQSFGVYSYQCAGYTFFGDLVILSGKGHVKRCFLMCFVWGDHSN